MKKTDQKKDYSVLLVLSLFLTALLIIGDNFKTGRVVSGDGSLLVESNPEGASIIVDGINMGVTRKLVTTSSGTHDVSVIMAGYLDYSTNVDVSPGEIKRISIDLTADPNYWDSSQYGAVKVISSPSRANVFIDDVYKGVTPITISNVKPGTHLIKVSKFGLKDYETTIYTYAETTKDITVNLQS